ncbi:glycerate kinase [Hydrogenophaga intermedia]|uniref:glycerate kinase n=1 Tax=Hydrogenophaga intermedia TaxID=65786 RepID=UPI0020436786|nr:glycerate kinase [Hydrogenophaga intermedia]MCM3563633.1 glycerate kinase [Hydrogenophaga intermedia]
MSWQRILVALVAAALLFWGHRQYGWPGVAAVAGGLLMWLLLHFTRLMAVMRRAAQRPIGHVDSAVMLNARLQAGMPLVGVTGLAHALGEQVSAEGEQPEIYRWTDPGGASVQARFAQGKLLDWGLKRPGPDGEPGSAK